MRLPFASIAGGMANKPGVPMLLTVYCWTVCPDSSLPPPGTNNAANLLLFVFRCFR